MDRTAGNLRLLNQHIIVLILYTAAAIFCRINPRSLMNATVFLNHIIVRVISTCLHE